MEALKLLRPQFFGMRRGRNGGGETGNLYVDSMGEKDLQMMRLRQSDHSIDVISKLASESLDESVEPQDKMYEQSDIDVSTLLIVHDESIIMEHKIFSIFNPVLWKKKKVKIVHA